MRLTFRAKVMTIVGSAALAFLVLIAASRLISNQTEARLTDIQERYVPKLELGPQLQSRFEHIGRSLQDAVAAHDLQALAATRELKDGLLQQLTLHSDAIDPRDAAALQGAIEDYYASAHEVSRQLISGETGESVVDAMTAMQSKQARALEQLKRATTFDRAKLTEAFSAATQALATAARVRLAVSIACLVAVILLSVSVSRGVLRALQQLTAGLKRFGGGDFSQGIVVTTQDELGELARQANEMAERLRRASLERDRSDWLKSGQALLAQELRGELEPEEVARRSTSVLARYLEAPAAALYYRSGQDPSVRLLAHYAISAGSPESEPLAAFRRGEGLVGQAALQDQLMVIADPPEDYLRIRSGLGEAVPRAIVLLPLIQASKVCGVLELALFKAWSDPAAELLLSIRESLTIAIEVARGRVAMRELLAETQLQSQRLATQGEELRANNEELQAQQDELRHTNEELRRRTRELETQRRALEEKNAELDDARRRLEEKTAELTRVSAYKSQFLANMSHELRTPLNSMLLLSNLLAANEAKNLTEKQVEFCQTIHVAGRDLLALINQVLDLSKIEAGKQETRIEAVPLQNLAEHAERVFGPLARHKGLRFVVEVAPGPPDTIATDRGRVEQILNNLLGNAIKFTERGKVEFRIAKADSGARFHHGALRPERVVALAVSDTGVGIAPEHQERVFAPFEQVEATSDRRFGGTGLGLTIAREIAALLGGEIQLRSTPGQGSTFICYLPYESPSASDTRLAPRAPAIPSGEAGRSLPPAPMATKPDRALVQQGDGHLLIIEDDPIFAEVLGEVVRAQGLNYQVAPNGETGFRLAKEEKPVGIILDVRLPDIDGWAVMERLRTDPATVEIPVHFISGVESAERGLAMGAAGYLTKPVTRGDLARVVESLRPRRGERPCRILVVERELPSEESLMQQLAAENVQVRRVTGALDALAAVTNERFDCMILDLSLPDMNGLELLKLLHERCGTQMPSVVIYTARALSKEETQRLEAYAEAIVLKEGPSAERLRNEVRLFVRRLQEGLSPRGLVVASALERREFNLEGKKVLVVDDDMRTVYAVSATLRAKGAEVFVADTGKSALAMLSEHPEVEAVLMDIMMPEMDGYEAMRRIRKDPRFEKLPIVALTAKAMKGDEEKCLQAGASDYLPKPIEADRLLAILQSKLFPNVTDESSKRN